MLRIDPRGASGVRQRRPGARLGALILAVSLGVSLLSAAPSRAEPLAEVNGDAITSEELEKELGAPLRQLEQQVYDLKRKQLDALVAQRLIAQEAAKRGMSVAELLDAEVTSKVGLVTEQEIEAFYQANKARLRGEAATLREQIRAHLQQQKLTAQSARFVEVLRSQARIVDLLQAPPIVRVEVPINGAPVRGATDAPVTIIEFSDFHCPFCKRVQPTLAQLLERYPAKVKLAYRDFPIDSLHPQARRAAEAARCARDQGKFWEYHDLVFSGPPSATSEDLDRYAGQAGLDVTAFGACLSGGVHRAAVQRDIDEAARLGLSGTPAFFINGRPITGAQQLEAFVRVIEEELAARNEPSAKTQ